MRLSPRLRRMVVRMNRARWFARVGPVVVPRLDRLVYRMTGGRRTATGAALPAIMLTTTGARSGQPRQVPLLTLPRDGDYYVVASNFGREHHPAWSANLLAHPDATVDRGGRPVAVRAHLLTPDEKEAMWPLIVAHWEVFATYRERTAGIRDLRVFRLSPAGQPDGAVAGDLASGDLPWGTISELVRDSAERFGDREAVVDGDLRLTFAELGERVERAARAAVAAGVEPGDRVAIWAPNLHEWIEVALGTLAAGGVLVPLNTRYKGQEAGYILRRSRARLLFAVTGFLDTDYVDLLRGAMGGATGGRPVAELEDLRGIVVLRGEAPAGTESWADYLDRGTAIGAEEVRRRSDAIAPDDLCDVMFTSGTTGHPKGALCTHGQTLRVFEAWSRLAGLRAGDRYLVVNPFFHTFGYKAGFLAAILRGATTIPHAVFDPGSVLARIEDERVTVLPGPPALYQALLDHPGLGRHDLSSLRLAVTGAAVVPVELVRRMGSDLGFDTVLTAYGLTEATGVVTMCRDGDDAETVAHTSGVAIPDIEVRVVDDAGEEMPRGQPGEVVVRGYNVTSGYLDEPEQTAATIVDGWLRTGDVGVMDERGYLRITDRKKDLFIVGGFNAYPAEIEAMLLEHDAIAQAAVVGVPDERLGEVGVAYVVPRSGAAPDPDEIVEWARGRMANFKVPRRVELVDALPVNASGKVLKHELRDRAIWVQNRSYTRQNAPKREGGT